MTYHVLSGLPRSGSTLLAALLRQNPRIHADMTSPVAQLYIAQLQAMNASVEMHHHFDTARRRRLLRAVFDAYYGDADSRPIVIDTHRSWSCMLPGLVDLFPATRAICCVRNVGWVVDSLERLARKHPHQLSALFGNRADVTVYERVEALCASNGMVGYSLDALKQACYGAEAGRVLVVRYETLCREPARALARIYAHLDEAPFEHDTANVQYDAEPFDFAVNTPGLHQVRRGVSFEPRDTVLPPDMFAHLESFNFWERPDVEARGIAIV